MKRIICTILTLFLFLINTTAEAAQNLVKKDITAVAADGFNIKATLTYPKVKGQREFPTVILLHSLGYNSQWWSDLPKDLLEKGYAVLAIDLRGHGASIYNSKLAKTSWKNMKNSAFSKCPDDVLKIMEVIKSENTRLTFFKNWAIVGADLGASVGVITADNYSVDLTYVKVPTKIEDLPSNGVNELPEYMWNEVVNRSVELALEDIESRRVQTKSQLNTIDE